MLLYIKFNSRTTFGCNFDWFNLAKVKNIMIAFTRNYFRVYLVKKSIYLDSK